MSIETSALEARVKELESELAAMRGEGARTKIASMSSEVVDSNPYSRLMALKRMGIVDNYEHIRKCRYGTSVSHELPFFHMAMQAYRLVKWFFHHYREGPGTRLANWKI